MSEFGDIGAIVLDVDGTLYRQSPVRLRMAIRLLGSCVVQPLRTRRAIRAIRAFRGSLEELRGSTVADQPAEQLRRAADRAGMREAEVREAIEDWMFERPLGVIGGFPQRGLHRFLGLALRRDVRLGVFSEYPAEDKLESLGVRETIGAVVSSHDPEVRRFKPDPAGFLQAARLLDTAPARTLVIGDREDADGAGARAAGMRFLRIGGAEHPSFETLCERVFPPEV